jgi:hypothetical protein
MQDDAYHAEVIVTRKPWPERKILFRCVLCEEDVHDEARWYAKITDREPICKGCTKRWGGRNGGPVFNRQNYHTLNQLSAMITRLQWEVRNGRRYRY